MKDASTGAVGWFHGADAGVEGLTAAETLLTFLDCHKNGKHPIASKAIAMGNSCFMKRLFGFCERKPLRRAEQKDNESQEVRSLCETEFDWHPRNHWDVGPCQFHIGL